MDTDEIRFQPSKVLRKAIIIPYNMPRRKRLALRDLHSNQDIIILSADKDNATMVLDSSD